MQPSNTVIILGSSRNDGNTRRVVDFIVENGGFDLIDLNDYQIGYFDYDNNHRNDDFMPLIKRVVSDYQSIIFATPVYWYSMSAIMKTFFDRISDLLIWEKDLGRNLRGKSMGVISCSGHNDLKEGFDMPFRESAAYLGMHYKGHVHTWVEQKALSPKAREYVQAFIASIDEVNAV